MQYKDKIMRNFKTLLPVFAALALFIIAQIYIVRQVWLQKDEVFALRYRSEADKAIEDLAAFDPSHGFKKAYFILDGVAQIFLQDSRALLNTEDSAKFAKLLREEFTKYLTDD